MATSSPRLRASDEKRRPSVFWPLAAVVVPILSLIARVEIIGGEKLPREGRVRPRAEPLHRVRSADRRPRRLAAGPRAALHGEGEPLQGSGARLGPARHRAWSRSRARRRRPPRGRPSRRPRSSSSTAAGSSCTPRARSRATPTCGRCAARPARCASRSSGDIPLIPMAHWGAQALLPRYGKLSLWPRDATCDVIVGDPVDLSAFAASRAQPAALVAGDRPCSWAPSPQLLVAAARRAGARRSAGIPPTHGQKETGRLEP